MARKANLDKRLKKTLDALVNDQRLWIASRGGSEAAYVALYGNPGVSCSDGRNMYGEGGTKIYNADIAELHRLEKLAGLR